MITHEIMGNVFQLDEYRTKAQKRELVKALQSVMGLQDWVLKVDHALDNGNMGECVADADTMSGEISLSPNLSAEELRDTTIHELGHVITVKLRELDFIKRLTSERAFAIIERKILEREEEVVENYARIISNLLKPR